MAERKNRSVVEAARAMLFGSIAYVHVPKEKQRKLDAKAEKCILVSYSDEQKGYKCYNHQTKQVRINRDVVFEELASLYLPSSPTSNNSIPISEDDVNEAEMPQDQEEIRSLEESLISFRLSEPNERPSRNTTSQMRSRQVMETRSCSPRA